jgi:signal transduction histidine kinase
MEMRFLTVVKRNRVVFVLACAVALSMVLISEVSYFQSVDRLDTLTTMSQARTNMQILSQSLVDAETGQRGYLLTGRKEYLAPYDGALKKIKTAFDFLDQYYKGRPEPEAMMAQLHAVSETKLSELSLTLHLYETDKLDAVKEVMLSGIGKEQMDAFRLLCSRLHEYELNNISQSRKSIYTTLMFNRLGVAALTLLSLVALFMYLRQIFLFSLQQQELRHMVQVERDRLEVEVVQRTAQLTELTHHLQSAREDERNRLARNLHDDLGSLLTSAKLDAARIKSRISATSPEALDLLAHLVSTINSCISLGRRIIEDLRPSALSNLGLVATLDILTKEFAEHSDVAVHCTLDAVQLTKSAELVVYRLVQEAITNITKYANAKNIWISLSAQEGRVEVSVRDDGAGFDTSIKPISAYGLMGMRFRVEAEGGVLTLNSAPGLGTRIHVTLPESKVLAT